MADGHNPTAGAAIGIEGEDTPVLVIAEQSAGRRLQDVLRLPDGDARVNAYADRIWGRASESSADAKATVARLKKGFTDENISSEIFNNGIVRRELFGDFTHDAHFFDPNNKKYAEIREKIA